MANPFRDRGNVLLAVLFALVAAGTLCVWGAAAAGLSFQNDFLNGIVQYLTQTEEERAAANAAVNGDMDGGVGALPPAGSDTGGASGNSGGGGGMEGDGGGGETGAGGSSASAGAAGGEGATVGDQDCLLGLICVDATVSTSAGGSGANAGSGKDCLLGLLCLNADADVAVGANEDDANVSLDAEVDADEDGLRINADAGVDGDADTDDDNGCLLGIICLNLGGTSGIDADANLSRTWGSWWDASVSWFVNEEAAIANVKRLS